MGWLFNRNTTPEPEEDDFLATLEYAPEATAFANELLESDLTASGAQEYYCGLCRCMMPITHFPH